MDPLRGADSEWLASADRPAVPSAMTDAASLVRQGEAALVLCRRELDRRSEAGCGHAAANDRASQSATGASRSSTKRDKRRSEVADRFDAAADGLEFGHLSGEHLDAVGSAVPDEFLDDVAEHQHDLFGEAAGLSPDEFRDRLRDFVRDQERQRGIDRAEQQRRRRHGSITTNARTGMVELRADLDPAVGAKVRALVQAEYARLFQADRENEDPRTSRQRMADAIADVVLSTGTAGDDRLPVVVVRRDGTATINGAPIDPTTAARYMCDTTFDIVTHNIHGAPVALNTVNRRANRAQRRALASFYDGCALPGCDVAFEDCHVHHIRPWSHTHTSDLHDLVPVCTREHHMLHEGRWMLRRSADWTDTWTSPDGQVVTHEPNAPPQEAVA